VINTLNSSALFWLDAHWSGGNTYGQSDTCPILDEIEIINRCKYDSFILIDDARLFLSPPPTPHRIELWPDITAIIAALNSHDHHRYTLVFQDVIIAVPQFSKQLVSEYVQQRNTELWAEHADQQNMLKKSLRNLGKVFSAQGKVDI
jgi:hypothetical protein